jgi:late competence protein required for DNA uptake (superfamily II DNA/RNA helicase)
MVIKAGADVPERVLALEVYGKIQETEIDAKVIEVAKTQQANIPVIIILNSIQKCEQLESNFENCFIFGKGRVAEQISCLNYISKLTAAPWPIILTTAAASLGHDFFPIAYVIQTELPA